MFTVDAVGARTTARAGRAAPFARVRRDYQPVTAGYYILHEGPLGVLGGTLQDPSYDNVKTEAEKHDGVAQPSRPPAAGPASPTSIG